jgi:carbonic anhydrase/acetyltransferase-like protein (isoleucine patch superfamily)
LPIHPFRGKRPQIDPTAFVAEGARLIGDVRLGPESSVWFHAVLRGDDNFIEVGTGTNVQDGSIVHVENDRMPTVIGRDCVIGHNAIIHGCTIGDGCLIGMGAIILSGARLGANCIVAAGAVVPEGREFPARSLLMGVPAKAVRAITDEELALIGRGARHYRELAREYRNPGAVSCI